MSEQLAIQLPGSLCRVTGDRLCVMDRDDMVLDVRLSPEFDGENVAISEWRRVGPNHLEADLGRFGKACLKEEFEKLAYWIETPVKQFENVTYLSDGRISGDAWRTFVSDDYDRVWPKSLDAHVPISSAYADSSSPDGSTGGGATDPDDLPPTFNWNVHVRACAVRGRRRWMGLSIPGPWGIGVTRLSMCRGRFSLRFEVLRPGCTDGKAPVLYFCPNLGDSLDVLDEHRTLSEKLGLMDLAPKSMPEWWTNPWQGYYDEWERHRHEGIFENPREDNVKHYLKEWCEVTRKTTDIHDLNVNFEQGCFRLYGDYRPAPNMGTEDDLRATLEEWRTDGIRAGLYIHPFIVNTKVPFHQEHPEAFCQPKDPGFLMDYPLEFWDQDDPKFAPIDWTHPKGREYMLDWVEYILSDKPGCLNFDILRSNHWRAPDPRCYDFHDPDWGIGDMMFYKVQKLMYERAKAVKPDALVTKIAVADCYMQPTYDLMQMSEEWTHSMECWWRRGQIATRLMKNSMLYTDPWFVTRTKWSEYYMGFLACNIPECQAATHTTHCYYPAWRPLAEKHYHRRKTGYHIYLHARPMPSDESRMTWHAETAEIEAWRRRTEGPLAGWYATLALGRKGIVSYSETQALLGVAEARSVSVPLPPKAQLQTVTRVLHSGGEEDHDHALDETTNHVRLHVEDCGGDVLYYRLRYTLT